MTEFADLDLEPSILKALEKIEYKTPSPIQAKAIPLILEKRDLIALAETGSGKTAACAIPICNQVDVSHEEIQALIVVPTRELCLQYAMETQKIGKYKKVKAYAVYGGDDMDIQQAKLADCVHVLVATPGRLIDLIYRRLIHLNHVRTFILDEADEMLSMGFFEDLDFLFDCLVQEHQVLLFSATMPADIKKLAKKRMNDPVEVVLQKKKAAPASIDHSFLYTKHSNRPAELQKLLLEQKPKQSIIFCESRNGCEQVYRSLRSKVQGVDFIHGGLSQDIRTSLTDKFRRGAVKHLVATDVAARGLDFSGVTHVFLYQLPKDTDTYIHRSGRTGRANRKGTVVSLVSDREFYLLRRVMQRINKAEPKWVNEAPKSFSMEGSDKKSSSRPSGKKRPPRRQQRRPRRKKDS